MITPTHLTLLRHGETDWNAAGRIQGHDGPGLNDAGRAQAEEAARSLNGRCFDAIYSSDLPRAYETALIIARALSLPVTTDPRLRERHHGDWQGRTTAELDGLAPGWRERWRTHNLDFFAPGGETTRQVLRRVAPALDEVSAAYPGGRVLIVSHGGVISVLRIIGAGLPSTELGMRITGNCELIDITWPPPVEIARWLGPDPE